VGPEQSNIRGSNQRGVAAYSPFDHTLIGDRDVSAFTIAEPEHTRLRAPAPRDRQRLRVVCVDTAQSVSGLCAKILAFASAYSSKLAWRSR